MTKIIVIGFCLAASVSLAGCAGDTRGGRTASDAAVGAGGGALLGAVAGFNPLVGAVVGGGAGAAVGATSK
jgi:hypothetical protein